MTTIINIKSLGASVITIKGVEIEINNEDILIMAKEIQNRICPPTIINVLDPNFEAIAPSLL